MMATHWILTSRARAMLQAGALAFGLLHAAEAGASDCGPRVAAFRETLEPVVEAVIAGQPSQVLAAAQRADAWWASHRASFARHARTDSMMGALRSSAGHRSYTEAAGIAVRTAAGTFEWCGPPANDAERLFLLDLAGMTGWLRARGMALEWPPRISEATDTLAAHLMRRHQVDLAVRLRGNVKATLGTPVATQGPTRAATSLLDLVDVVEKVLR